MKIALASNDDLLVIDSARNMTQILIFKKGDVVADVSMPTKELQRFFKACVPATDFGGLALDGVMGDYVKMMGHLYGAGTSETPADVVSLTADQSDDGSSDQA